MCWINSPSVLQHDQACSLGFPCARSRHSLVWGRDELPQEKYSPVESALKSSTDDTSVPLCTGIGTFKAQGRHDQHDQILSNMIKYDQLGQQANRPRSLSQGPCGNAYTQSPRVNAWIRAWPARQARKHIRSIDVIHVSAPSVEDQWCQYYVKDANIC